MHLQEDGESSFWEQESQQNIHQEQSENGRTQPNLLNDEEDEFMVDSWRNQNPFHNQMLEEDLEVQYWIQLQYSTTHFILSNIYMLCYDSAAADFDEVFPHS